MLTSEVASATSNLCQPRVLLLQAPHTLPGTLTSFLLCNDTSGHPFLTLWHCICGTVQVFFDLVALFVSPPLFRHVTALQTPFSLCHVSMTPPGTLFLSSL
ncbi:hypothetical protein E2C01_063878 [Portunus trituberculatus]|uniref:Uncharacterized protein n=1 Tax=Portunus trituberculatus TaxID=210409 RepID=A0A5B7HLR8_PORTR|nr:hypothetical protein [Portunus trituberculatus]